ncbi:SDR family NAD(P)-dependent oxidoreductase [Novosphingobium lentum]|uniref:SDR family NAD(P)-dependent oxidoreductase n=1 Tax=Novosphingobium lentum TaxID=145287 RepID=UPI000A5C6C55|nr:SDR family oxidoreductase [Novosphingobium lentum]
MMGWPDVAYDFNSAAVVVTGGTGGLGGAVAAAFRDAGAQVTITGTRGGPDDYDEDLSGFDYKQLDVEDRAAIDRFAGTLDRLDVLVNSAGIALYALGLDEYDPDVFERAVAMHLTGVYRLTMRCEPLLLASKRPGGASVVSMASMSSFFGIDIVPGYGAGKSGLVGMTRVLAVHWGKAAIRVNALAVGLARSKMTGPVFDMPDVNDAMLARVPMGRHGEGEDVAGAALFLSSSAASWITGQVLAVDGGFSIAG